MAQIDNNSDYQWSMSIGGAGNDTVGALLAMDDGTIVSGGDFSGTVWFGDTLEVLLIKTYSFGYSNTTRTMMELPTTRTIV